MPTSTHDNAHNTDARSGRDAQTPALARRHLRGERSGREAFWSTDTPNWPSRRSA